MELNKVEVKATIGGTECYIINMRLEQGFNSHHIFEIVVDYNDLDTKWMESPEKIFKLLGKDVIIEMKHKKGDGTNLFIGIITQASYIGHHGGQNHIRISGCSKTIKLDGSKTMDSFMDMTLSSIVTEVIGTSGNGGEVTPQPKFTGTIDYICQYDETCFEFLNRLSWIYGEWFFYDGQKCYFGKQDGDEEKIVFESDITTFNLSANLVPSQMKRYHYLVHDDRETDKKAPDPSTSGYHSVAKEQSSSIFTSDAKLPMQAVILNESELEAVIKTEKNRATFSMLTISGTSETSKVKIGGKIKVNLPKKMDTTKKEVDTFLVTSVIHEFDLKAQYRNTFTAIPSTVENIPMEQIYFPKAYSQLAWVKSNNDTDKKGRVKVQFQWQKSDKTTNWIRVQTPDAGPGSSKDPKAKYKDKVPENRGFVFIPEEGDIVMTGFEYGDPNRPFVAGSIFSEKKSKGGKDDNHIKTITTRTAHVIEFNDKEDGAWGITIKDYNGNIVNLDTKGKNITITAPKTITMNATDIIMNATKSVSVHSPEINIGDTGGDLANKTIDLQGKAITFTGGDTILAEAPAITIDGAKTLDETSTTITMNGSKQIDITGGLVKINS